MRASVPHALPTIPRPQLFYQPHHQTHGPNPYRYPSIEELKETTYPKYKETFNFDNMHFESFIDCHEQQCETPTNKLMHSVMWSEYKQRTTLKFLAAITGCGAFSFCSNGHAGRITDPGITRVSGFLDTIHPHGVTGADKGFDMHSDFVLKRHYLIMPPKAKKGQEFFTSDQMADTAGIARLRIHVERAFERAQEFRILHRTVPITMIDEWSMVFKVCCLLCNFQPPLVSP